MSTRNFVCQVANALIRLTKILWALFAHGYMEENVKRFGKYFGGTHLEFKIEKDENSLIENLTERKFSLYILLVVEYLFQNLTLCTFFSNSDTL